MGHKQPAIPLQVDNSMVESIVNKRVQPKRTKAMDMRFHWLRDHSINQKQFHFLKVPRPYKLRGLLDETSSSGASPKYATSIPNTFQQTTGAPKAATTD
jgi:hypothetical protein